MIDNQCRSLLEKILTPVSKKMPSFISPDLITLLGFIVTLFTAIAIVTNNYIIALILFISNRILDAFDGNVARTKNIESKYGYIFDISSDFFTYSIIPICIAIQLGTKDALLITSILLATYYVNSGIWTSLSKVTEPEAQGLVEGLETTIFYIAMIIFHTQFVSIGILFAILIIITIILRLVYLISTNIK